MGDFETCVRPLRREMVLLARRLTRSHAAADDIVQEAMLRAWRAWPRWTPRLTPGREITPETAQQCLRQWLVRITTNMFSNQYQKRLAEQRALGDESWADVIAGAHGEPAQSPDHGLDGFGDEVTEAMDVLLPERRELMLMEAADMRLNEISEVTATPIGTVMSRGFRARADLRERLAEYAAREYGIGPLAASGRAGVDASRGEAPEVPETDTQAVDGIMSYIDDPTTLLG